jgi:hypothetical protein
MTYSLEIGHGQFLLKPYVICIRSRYVNSAVSQQNKNHRRVRYFSLCLDACVAQDFAVQMDVHSSIHQLGWGLAHKG